MTKTKALTNALLKDVMTDAMVIRGVCADLDTCKANGIYSLTADTKNRPIPGIGIAEVICRGNAVFQRVIPLEVAYICMRSTIQSGSAWMAWRTFNPSAG